MILIWNKHIGDENYSVHCTTITMSRSCHILQQSHMHWHLYVTMVYRAPQFILSKVLCHILMNRINIYNETLWQCKWVLYVEILKYILISQNTTIEFILRRPSESMWLCNLKFDGHFPISPISSVDRAHDS